MVMKASSRCWVKSWIVPRYNPQKGYLPRQGDLVQRFQQFKKRENSGGESHCRSFSIEKLLYSRGAPQGLQFSMGTPWAARSFFAAAYSR